MNYPTNDAKWVTGILGAIDGRTPPTAAMAIVYAVNAALKAEIAHQDVLYEQRTVASMLGLKMNAGPKDILDAIAKLKQKTSRAHTKTVLRRWSKAKPRKGTKR